MLGLKTTVAAKTGRTRLGERHRERVANDSKATWRLGRREGRHERPRRVAAQEDRPARYEEDAERWDGLS